MLTFQRDVIHYVQMDFLKSFAKYEFWGPMHPEYNNGLILFFNMASNGAFENTFDGDRDPYLSLCESGVFDVGTINDVKVAFWLDGNEAEYCTNVMYIVF